MSTKKYVPPLSKGQRVRLLTEFGDVQPGTLGTITWTHPFPDLPYRVKWDGFEDTYIGFGMSDIGWLTKPEEIEAVGSTPTDSETENTPKLTSHPTVDGSETFSGTSTRPGQLEAETGAQEGAK